MKDKLLLNKQYEIEKKWAEVIKNAQNKQERELFIKNGYNELRKFYFDNNIKSENSSFGTNDIEDFLILNLIGKNKIILEIGFGSGNTIRNLAPFQKKIIGIEKSDYCLKMVNSKLGNFKNVDLNIGDLLETKFTKDNFDAVYCIQVLEHLVPKEVGSYLNKIHDILKRNAILIISTCNRFTGPHDISKNFSEVAKGFHLKEYTYLELTKMLKEVGFRKIYTILNLPNKIYKLIPFKQYIPFLKISVIFKCLLEQLFAKIKVKYLRKFCFKLLRLNAVFLISYK